VAIVREYEQNNNDNNKTPKKTPKKGGANNKNNKNRSPRKENKTPRRTPRDYYTESQDGELHEQGYKRRIRNDLINATKGKDVESLEKALEKFEKNRLEDWGEDLSDARDRLELLKLKRDLRDSVRRNHVGVMEKTIERARKSKFVEKLQPQIDATEAKMLNQMELNRYAHDILAMEPGTISEIHSYHRPPPCVHDVMAASYMLLGHDESQLRDWTYIQGMAGRLGKESLITQVKEFDTALVEDDTARRVREIIDYHDLDEIRAASNGAATFHCWADSITRKINHDKENAAEDPDDIFRQEEQPPSLVNKQQIARGRK